MRVLFLLPVAGQPRYRKRIAAFLENGVDAEVAYFERDYVPAEEFGCSAKALGELSHGNYLRRIPALLSALTQVIPLCRKVDLLYCFGLDMAILSLMSALRKPFVYEVGDITKLQLSKGMSGKLVRFAEKIVCRTACSIVVTSNGFIRNYYDPAGLRADRFHVIENKITEEFVPRTSTSEQRDYLVIGYFGLIRCSRSLKILKRISDESKGKVRVYVRGISFGVDLQQYCGEYFEYGGAYTAPDDFGSMYGKVDIVWACNSSDRGDERNWLWARTNRFFESCYFQKPLISLKGGEEGAEVESKDIGITISLLDSDVVSKLLESFEALPRWRFNLGQLPVSRYRYTSEHVDLLSFIYSKNARIPRVDP